MAMVTSRVLKASNRKANGLREKFSAGLTRMEIL